MQKSRGWYQMLAISLLVHGMLLSGVTLLAGQEKAPLPEEEYVEMQLVSEPAALQEEAPILEDTSPQTEPPVVTEEQGEKIPEIENKVLDAGKEQKEGIQPKAAYKSQPVIKDIPAQMLLHYNKKQLELALLQYNQALSMNSKAASVYSNRGQVYYDKGELDKALGDFNQGILLNPQLASAHIGRGYIYIKKQQWELAFDDFNQGLLVEPQNPLAHYGRALCFSVQGDKSKAIQDFQLFIQYAAPGYEDFIQKAQEGISKLRQ